jgi:hypothetical protein
MAQTNFTPISLYYSTTAAAVPTAGNLVAGELAINTQDGKLFYKDAAGVVQTLASKDTNSGTFTNISVSGVATFGAGTVSLPSITTTGDTNTGIFFPAADTIAFTEGGVEAARFDSSGNLGIGTVNPAARLQSVSAAGTIQFRWSDATNGTANLDHGTGISRMWSNVALAFGTGAESFTERMRIDSAGNVGIGLTNPTKALDVYRGSADCVIRTQTASASGLAQVEFRNTQAGCQIGMPANVNAMNFITADNERMRIDSSGNVIIGATSSAQKFKVYLNSSAEGNASTAGFTQDGAGDAAIAFLIGAATEWLAGVDNSDSDKFKINNITGGGNFTNTGLNITTGGNVEISGSLSKGSGSFRIDHPLPQLTETHQLVHSFVEAPKADLIYRGRVTLVNGKAIVNIDEIATMTEGTFEVLCCDVQCFTTNESDWTPVRGSVTGNILTIESQDATAKSEISWMVIGERKDKHMMDTDWTDENGKVIVEPLKEITN